MAGCTYSVKVVGPCPVRPEAILATFLRHGPEELLSLGTECVIVIEGDTECFIVCPPYGTCAYYYTIHNRQLFHADTVLEVLRQSGLEWSWNWKSLCDLFFFDHVLENETLHPAIHRVPYACVLHFRDGSLQESRSTPWEELHPLQHPDPAGALDAFNKATHDGLADAVTLSMSAGMDSRAILSSLLKGGCRPLLVVAGDSEDSTDVRVSKLIASALGLELVFVRLAAEQYLAAGEIITKLTNGAKGACHWHTYLYAREAKLTPHAPFFVGANGEFARSFYLDKGFAARAVDAVSPAARPLFWWLKLLKQRLVPAFKSDELGLICEDLANEYGRAPQRQRLSRLVRLCPGGLLAGLDRFYLEQRVRNFIGNGLKLYAASVSCRTPFLNRDWVTNIWNLPRSWKQDSRWHRFAIEQNCPQLLEYPEQGGGDTMQAGPRPFYWTRNSAKYPKDPIVNYQRLFRNKAIREYILEHKTVVSELFEPRLVAKVMQEHDAGEDRTRALGILLTMIHWIRHLNSAT